MQAEEMMDERDRQLHDRSARRRGAGVRSEEIARRLGLAADTFRALEAVELYPARELADEWDRELERAEDRLRHREKNRGFPGTFRALGRYLAAWITRMTETTRLRSREAGDDGNPGRPWKDRTSRSRKGPDR